VFKKLNLWLASPPLVLRQIYFNHLVMSTAVPAACQHEAVAFSPSGKRVIPLLCLKNDIQCTSDCFRAPTLSCASTTGLKFCGLSRVVCLIPPALPLATAETLSPRPHPCMLYDDRSTLQDCRPEQYVDLPTRVLSLVRGYTRRHAA
jgi:hypothetical protein